MADEPADNRTPLGQFRPGTSGNPGGRPAGVPNKLGRLTLTKLAEAEPDLIAKAIAMALAGSEPIMRVLLDKLIPAARPVANLEGVALPPMSSPRDLPAVCAALLTALHDGTVSLADVQPALQIIETMAQAIHAHDLDVRITALERFAERERLRVVR